MGVPECLFGLPGLAAGDQVAGVFGDDPGPVERAGSFLGPGAGLPHRPVQEFLACPAVAAGERGLGGLPQQAEWHGHAVAVEQADRVLAELERGHGGPVAEAGDGAGGAGGGDGRVIGGQREPGQLHIQHPVTGRPRCATTPGGEQRPGGDGGQSSLFSSG